MYQENLDLCPNSLTRIRYRKPKNRLPPNIPKKPKHRQRQKLTNQQYHHRMKKPPKNHNPQAYQNFLCLQKTNQKMSQTSAQPVLQKPPAKIHRCHANANAWSMEAAAEVEQAMNTAQEVAAVHRVHALEAAAAVVQALVMLRALAGETVKEVAARVLLRH